MKIVDPVQDIVLPTCVAGSTGAAFGAVLAAVRAQSVPAYMISTGLNWTMMSGTFFSLRAGGLQFHSASQPSLGYRIGTSALSGMASGALMNAIARGRTGLLNATVVYGTVGAFGQYAADVISATRDNLIEANRDKQRKPGSWVVRKLRELNPVRTLSDEEFFQRIKSEIEDLDKQIKLADEEIELAKAELLSSKPAAR
ncbi:hypothetical protein PYCC9005_002405 [Savitreella phatthalungensis]